MHSPVVVGSRLDITDVAAVARNAAPATLDPGARDRLAATRSLLESALDGGATIYGVNTGFGALSETRIPAKRLRDLQLNLLRSHAVGVGPPLDADVVRAMLLMRAHTLALGASGCSPALCEHLLRFLKLDLLPVVPSQGSVGASGDLAPLAHLALPLLGEGEVWVEGVPSAAGPELARRGIEPFDLGPKEGLSLINGTQVTTAIAALALSDAFALAHTADVIGAMALDATLGTVRMCDPRIHAGKPHEGQRRSAARIAALVEGSQLNQSHAGCGRVQDAYSLRCMPQVHGSVRAALQYAADCTTTEINSFTDNPLVLLRDGDGSGPDDPGFDVVSGGNFHAAAVALPADHAAAALTTLATISERRLDRLLNPQTSRGLPAFLADDPGLESGFMMAQVTAAALCSECKALSHPASVDTIPTSAGKEDHVSMGPIAARKLAAITKNVARVLAIEAAVTARALDLREADTSETLQRVHGVIRTHVAPTTGDRSMAAELEALAEALCTGALSEAAGLDAASSLA
jgi:histidine ammonia-lyase